MSYSIQSAFLSNLIYDNSRVNQGAVDTKVHYVGPNGTLWEVAVFMKSENGYQGAVFKNVNTGEIVLVNRGTELGVGGGYGSPMCRRMPLVTKSAGLSFRLE